MRHSFAILAALGILSQDSVMAAQGYFETGQHQQRLADRYFNKLIELYKESVEEDKIDAEKMLLRKVSPDILKGCKALLKELDTCFSNEVGDNIVDGGYTPYSLFEYEMFRKTTLKLVVTWLDKLPKKKATEMTEGKAPEMTEDKVLEYIKALTNDIRKAQNLKPISKTVEREYGTTDGAFTLHIPYIVLVSSDENGVVDFIGDLAFDNLLDIFQDSSVNDKITEMQSLNQRAIKSLQEKAAKGFSLRQDVRPLMETFKKLGVIDVKLKYRSKDKSKESESINVLLTTWELGMLADEVIFQNKGEFDPKTKTMYIEDVSLLKKLLGVPSYSSAYIGSAE